MIYIVNKNIEHDFIKTILDILKIENSYIELDLDEVDNLINNSEYDGIFLPFTFNEYLKKHFEKEYNKLFNCSDFITYFDGKHIIKNSVYLGIKEFIKNENLSLDKKTVLILGSSNIAISLYNAIKDVGNPVVYISTITDELDTKLRVGDRKIRKIEIMNLLKSDFIINTTELGNSKAINTSMLEGVNIIPTQYAIDLLVLPLKTSFLRKYELDNSKIYTGLYILIYRVLAVLGYKSFEKVNEIYNKIIEGGINFNEL